MRRFFIPEITVAAYSGLVLALVAFGLAIAALSVALVALGVPHAE